MSITYVNNCTFGTYLAFQMSVLEAQRVCLPAWPLQVAQKAVHNPKSSQSRHVSHIKQSQNISGAQGWTKSVRPAAKSTGIKSVQQGTETSSQIASTYVTKGNNKHKARGRASMTEASKSGFQHEGTEQSTTHSVRQGRESKHTPETRVRHGQGREATAFHH